MNSLPAVNAMNNIVKVADNDCLAQDAPLRGQNFACLSFISPEDAIKKKEVFVMEKFLEFFSVEMTELFQNMALKFPEHVTVLEALKVRYGFLFEAEKVNDEYRYFISANSDRLESAYFKQNDFQTSIRGIKVRGVFESLREAEIRAKALIKIDETTSVFVAEVGCWCPWNPVPEDVDNHEYALDELNSLMSAYKKNSHQRDEFFAARREEAHHDKLQAPLPEEADPWTQTHARGSA